MALLLGQTRELKRVLHEDDTFRELKNEVFANMTVRFHTEQQISTTICHDGNWDNVRKTMTKEEHRMVMFDTSLFLHSAHEFSDPVAAQEEPLPKISTPIQVACLPIKLVDKIGDFAHEFDDFAVGNWTAWRAAIVSEAIKNLNATYIEVTEPDSGKVMEKLYLDEGIVEGVIAELMVQLYDLDTDTGLIPGAGTIAYQPSTTTNLVLEGVDYDQAGNFWEEYGSLWILLGWTFEVAATGFFQKPAVAPSAYHAGNLLWTPSIQKLADAEKIRLKLKTPLTETALTIQSAIADIAPADLAEFPSFTISEILGTYVVDTAEIVDA